MFNIINNVPESHPTVFLKDIPTGTTFTGKIAHFKYRLFLKLGPKAYRDYGEVFGSSGYIMALDKEPTLMTYDCMWDAPECKVDNYVPVNVDLVIKPINN